MEQNTIPKPNNKFFLLNAREAFHVIHEVAKQEGARRGLDMHWPTFRYWNAAYMAHMKKYPGVPPAKRKRGRPRLNQPSEAQYKLGVF